MSHIENRPALIPYPKHVEWTEDCFDLCEAVRIIHSSDASGAIVDAANVVASVLRECGAIDVSVEFGDPANPGERAVGIATGAVADAESNSEAYRLEVGADMIKLTAPEPVGLYWGAQTIRQLSMMKDNKPVLAGGKITDWPAFTWRGYMLDPARNFWSLPLMREQIEVLARYKMNVFHFHLTDYTAWRMEIKLHPELTQPEFQTRQPGSFYAQSEIKDLIEFARQRHVLAVPEIDMPGHSTAFRNATGFDMQSPEGMAVLKDVLDEVCEVFDSPYIHIGADEVRITNEGFLPAMAEVVRSHGREVIIWMPGSLLDDDAIYELWYNAVPPANSRCIDSRPYYINHLEPLSGVLSTFNKRICDSDKGSDKLLGAEAPLWHDRRANSDMDMLRMSPVYPIMLTLSERAWRGGGYPEVESRFMLSEPGTEALDCFKEFENRLIRHRDKFFDNQPFPYIRQTDIVWRLTGPFPNDRKMDAVFAPESEIRDSYELDGEVYGWKQARGGTIWLCDWYSEPGQYNNTTVYALTYAKVDKEQDAFMWIGFHHPVRSDHDGTPELGYWDNRGSNIWLNDEAIPAPRWTEPGRTGNIEEPLIDEGYPYRPPTPVRLKAGWNKILVRVPRAEMDRCETLEKLRRDPYPPDKWMFTAVLVSWNGERAKELDGVTYSTQPEKGIR